MRFHQSVVLDSTWRCKHVAEIRTVLPPAKQFSTFENIEKTYFRQSQPRAQLANAA